MSIFDFGSQISLILVLYTQSVFRIFAWNVVPTRLGAPGSGWPRKRKLDRSFCFRPAVNAYLLVTSSKVCDWSGHIFGASASPRSLTKKSVYGTLFHCSWRLAWYQICDIRPDNECCIRGWRSSGFYARSSSYMYQVFIYQAHHTSKDKKIGAASTAVPSSSNKMHNFPITIADLRLVPADIICPRLSTVLTQHLQAYPGAKGGKAFVHHPSFAANIIIPAW